MEPESQTPAPQPQSKPANTPDENKITRGHSCILCQQRKVKCDKQKPCSNCMKARAECVPSAPTQPRRRKRKLTETDLADRLKRYEHLLRKHGVKLDDEDQDEMESRGERERSHPHPDEFLAMHAPRPKGGERGALFANKENSHYVENTLWENLRDEIQDPKEALLGSSDEEMGEASNFPFPESLLLGSGTMNKDLSALHPTPVQIFRLWQTFLVNVNPLIKVFHAPTVQQMILDATGDLKKVPRPIEALMFGIYFLSISSLSNEECEGMFGESRLSLLAKYSHGAQQSLINSRFMKSLSIITLQSYVLYLLGVRDVYDPHSLWVLTGVAVRISQRLGVHRDGASHQISPFDAEVRRRTWWQIVFLDGHSSKLAGAGFPAWLSKFDTKVPLNISDSDLSPGMKEPPTEKDGATEMLFCCLKFETAQALRSTKTFAKGEWQMATGNALLVEKDQAINGLEVRFEEKFLRYCDPSIPLHLLCIYVAKSVICTMRIMAHHPRQYPDKGASLPQSEKDFLFTESLKEIEYDALGHNTKAIKGYKWHITSHFQLDAFIYLLSELRHRTTGDLVNRAWQQITFSFDNRPDMLADGRNSLYTAIGNLALKAWAKREEAIGTIQEPPRFITRLREQRNIPNPPQTVPLPLSASSYPSGRQNANIPAPMPNVQPWTQPEFTFEPNMPMPEITPVDWEYWQTLMDGDLPAYQGQGGSDNTTGTQWFT